MKKIITFLGFVFVSTSAFSAGYLEFDSNGTPYKWGTSSPISYKVDGSGLGAIPKADPDGAGPERGADDIVDESFAVWASGNIPDSTLSFVNGGTISPDINATNYEASVNTSGTSCLIQDFAVVYDDDGSIFSDMGLSSGVLGFASPSVFSDSTHKITCGYAFINGAAITGNTITDQNQLKYTLMHEFGHGLNLQHSQLNTDLFLDADNSNDQYVPLMFPYIPEGLSFAITGGLGGIKLDDEFSLLNLYNQSVLNSEGGIKGTVKDRAGEGALAVNAVCFDKNNPEQNVVSHLSGTDLDKTGNYHCGHLPAGDYQVRIEPVVFAINNWDEGIPPFIAAEYYNGDSEAANPIIDVTTEKTDITVSSSIVENINLVLNEDGRITSAKKITGTISAASPADLEYFIYVPKSVTKATFALKGGNTSGDIDLYGRCGSAFSLAISTAGPIYNPNSSSQQAEFAGASDTAVEDVVLSSGSTPKVSNCSEAHLLLYNYASSSNTFELTATLEGKKPELKADFSPQKSKQDNGDTLVSLGTFEAENDQFSVTGITFTDLGTASLSGVSAISIYEDENKNGKVDSSDILLSQTSSVNSSDRTFTFSNFELFIDEGKQKKVLITYALASSASSSGLLVFVLIGLVIGSIFCSNKKSRYLLMLLFASIVFGRCSGSGSSDYNPTIDNDSQLTATASGFGDQFSLQVGKPKSVADFFE